jgi:hypothetical protein
MYDKIVDKRKPFKVGELIEELKKIPADYEVCFYSDEYFLYRVFTFGVIEEKKCIVLDVLVRTAQDEACSLM